MNVIVTVRLLLPAHEGGGGYPDRARGLLDIALREHGKPAAQRSAKRSRDFSRGLQAATTLLKTMIDQATPASVRVGAAEAIFNHAANAIEIEDIEARMAELERGAQAAGKRN
jgi:hypothetical protein